MKHHLFLQGFAAAMLALCAVCAADLGDTLADPQPLVFSAVQLEGETTNGEWKTVTSGAEVTFGGNNGTLRLRGISSYGTGERYNTADCAISFTNDNVPVAASGDIRTLVDYKNYDNVNTESARFRCLFQNCTALTSAPELNATALAYGCYLYMFKGCTNLKTAPELPATTLVASCYKDMFYGCKNLNEVTIKAEKAADGVTIDGALNWWLYNVASEGTIHKKSTLTLKQNSVSGIPSGWTAKDDVTD